MSGASKGASRPWLAASRVSLRPRRQLMSPIRDQRNREDAKGAKTARRNEHRDAQKAGQASPKTSGFCPFTTHFTCLVTERVSSELSFLGALRVLAVEFLVRPLLSFVEHPSELIRNHALKSF